MSHAMSRAMNRARSWLPAVALLASCSGEAPTPTAQGSADAALGPAGAPANARASPPPAWGGLPALSSAQAHAAGLLTAELTRDAHAEALTTALASNDQPQVDRAALSLARIGGAAAAQVFADWLGDGQRPMSAATMGAVAVLAPPEGAAGEAPEPAGVWAQLENNLWTRYAVTDDEDRAAALLLAVARVGGKISVRNLAVDLTGPHDPLDAGRFERGAEALAILCVRRHVLSADAVTALATGLSATSTEVRRGSAYALSRCAGPSAERLAGSQRAGLVERLSALVSGHDQGEALAAWRALEALGEPPALVPDGVLGKTPPPWQQEVAAVRALGASVSGRRELSSRLGKVSPWEFEGPRVHVLLEALRVLRRAVDGTPELLAPFEALGDRVEGGLASTKDPRRRKELALVHCETKVLQAVRSGSLDEVRQCAKAVPGLPDYYGDLKAIDATLAMGGALTREARVDLLLAAARDPRPAIATAATAGLADVDDVRIAALLRELVGGSNDVGVVSAAAGAIATRSVDRSRRDASAVPVLRAAVQRLANETAVEARIEAIGALGSLARSRESTRDNVAAEWLGDLVGLATDGNQAVRDAARAGLTGWPVLIRAFDAAVPARFEAAFAPEVGRALDVWLDPITLIIETSAGSFRIDMSSAPAPIAQANLAALASKGYFDGLTFHRVVPGFVVQGGDPRGDGYGGPGHLMPCEWSNIRYERGTVGIALAGKDTGGSQLFITHGAPHHLDARYAVVGTVVEGMDVVDRLLPYDTIDRATVMQVP